MGRKADKRKQIQQRRAQRKNDRQMKKNLHKKMGKGDRFKQSKEYVDYFDKFNKEIAFLRIKARDVGGDGNCLFRSFADQIDGSQMSHKFMRSEACRYMRENQDFFKPFLDQDEDGPFDKYLKDMQKDGQWGGHLQLQALCQCFKCVIVIHKRNNEQFDMKPMTQQPTFGIVHLGYFQHEDFQHYVSIRQIDDDSEQPAIQKLQPLNKNMYEHLLYADMEEYMIQKQLQEMKIIQNLTNQFENVKFQEQPQPFPNYPRNKKCKCGSKESYKNCCYKEYQKNKAKKWQN